MVLRRIVVASREAQIYQLARKFGQEIFAADNLQEAIEITQKAEPNLAIFDSHFQPDHIELFIHRAKANGLHVPVVIADSKNDEAVHRESLESLGVTDCLCGKDQFERLGSIIAKIKNTPKIHESQDRTESFYCDEIAATVSMVGHSESIKNSIRTIKMVAQSKCNPVLILGETGTGKELAARAVHQLRHPSKRFVAINCAALTANLLESELFGHVKGSFTGADCEKTGLMELAGSGTVFLDEISEMPIDLQAKLLRVLHEKTFRKVGGVKDITCKATIIASSNRDLHKQIDKNDFRRDLFYRLNIYPVVLAPLRSSQRQKDIALLAEYFLKNSTVSPEKSRKITGLTKMALEQLHQHDWPGNVRELRNVIDRALMLETTDKIGLNSIIIHTHNITDNEPAPAAATNGQIKDFSLAKAEKQLVARALHETGWQKTKAAAMLGITRATLYAKVKQYKITQDTVTASKSRDEVVLAD